MAIPGADLSAIQAINAATGYPDLAGSAKTSPSSFGVRPAPTAAQSPSDYYSQLLASTNAQTAAILAQSRAIQNQINAAPKLLPFDYMGTLSTAKQQASNAINPIYQQKFNTFLTQARVNEQRKTEDYNKVNTLADELLKNSLEGTQTTRTRTGEDVQTATNQINDAAGNYQTDQGLAFNNARLALARTGNVGSGLDVQGANQQAATQNTAEGRQIQSYDIQKQAQQLYKTRTYEDLSKTDVLSGRQNTLTKEQNQTDLNRFIQDYGTTNAAHYGTQIQAEIDQEAIDRANAIQSATGGYYNNLLNQYISTLKGARAQDIQATVNTYRQ